MFSELTTVDVMNEAELRASLAQYKQLYYPDPTFVPGLDELAWCMNWMARSSNGQVFTYHFAKVLVDGDEATIKHFRHAFERMRSSAEHYVQLWHYQRQLSSMTDATLKDALESIYSYRKDDGTNLGGLFWPKGSVPSW